MVGVHSLDGMVHKVELQRVWTSRPLLGLRALALRSYPAAESWRIRRGIDVEGAKNQEGPRSISPTVLVWLTVYAGIPGGQCALRRNLRPHRYDGGPQGGTPAWRVGRHPPVTIDFMLPASRR